MELKADDILLTSEICNEQKSKSPKYEEKKRLLDIVDKYKTMLFNLNPGHELTLDAVRMVVEGKVTEQTKESFIGTWVGQGGVWNLGASQLCHESE